MSARKIAIAAVACCLSTAVAQAQDFALPQRWNDDYLPGSRCAAPGAQGTYVLAHREWFKLTDASSVANRNAQPVPVTHQVTEQRVETTEVSMKVKTAGELEKYLSRAYGFNFVHEVYWKLGQTVGPYTLQPGEQGKLVWGFTMLDATAQDVTCTTDQVWVQTSQPYAFTTPVARHSELRIEGAPDFG